MGIASPRVWTVASVIPAEVLQQLLDLFSLYAIKDTLSADVQTSLEDVFGAFDNAKDNDFGIRFSPDTDNRLGSNALMGAVLYRQGDNLVPVVNDGFATILVHDQAYSSRSFGEALHTILIHELLHLNPDYGARALERFMRGDTFNADRYNDFHQDAFFNRAERLRRIIRRNLDLIEPTNVIQGQGGDDTLIGYGQDNELYGRAGDNTFIAYGFCDYLWGGTGNDRYVFAVNSQAYVIRDDGGENSLEIQGPYTTAHLRIGYLDRYLLLAVVDDPGSTETAYEMGRVVMIPIDPVAGPAVQTVEVGGAAYALPSLQPLNNSRPEFMGPVTFNVPQSQFNSPNIAYVNAEDREGDPLTYSVVGVTGLGATGTWSFSGNLLRTTYRNPGHAGFTLVTAKVSDGHAEDQQLLRVNWLGRTRPTG